MEFTFRAKKILDNAWALFEGDMQVPFLKIQRQADGSWRLQDAMYQNAHWEVEFADAVVGICGLKPDLRTFLAAIRIVRVHDAIEAMEQCLADQAVELAYERYLEDGGPHAAAIQAEDEIEREREANDPWLCWLRSGRDDAATAH